MRLLYFATGLLWVLLVALVLAVGVVLTASDDAITLRERVISVGVLLLLLTPVVLQLRVSHKQIRDMNTNRIVLTDKEVEVHLGGGAREWKGLPAVSVRLPAYNSSPPASKSRNSIFPEIFPQITAMQVCFVTEVNHLFTSRILGSFF